LASNLEAAESILLCAEHQRRIVDDVLTLSKLDSALVTVVPTAFQPDQIKEEAMRMFQAEYASNNIDVETLAEEGEYAMTDHLVGDSARVMQILVNLLTNSIKFTKGESVRKIQIHYGACNDIPPASKFGDNFNWSESPLNQRDDPTTGSDYGTGQALYLYWAVTDSGVGLKSEEAVRVFEKFNQARRRTHIKYGGSGLGLYISRELAEMQAR
jgi:signal transduction histidine kinase